VAKRVLITGGAGFIGANLCRRLLIEGHDVVVIDDLSTGTTTNLHGLDVDLRVGSIMDQCALNSAADNVDTIVHLAAVASVAQSIVNPVPTHDINVNGTMNVLLATRAVGAHLIFASSSSVYGSNAQLPNREDMRLQPGSPYAASKSAAEAYVLTFQSVYQMPSLAFRFFNAYGPLQPADHAYAAVIPRFALALLNDEPLVIYGDGGQCRDFTAVSSIVDVLTDAINRQVCHPEPVNLASGSSTTLIELIELLEGVVAKKARVIHHAERIGDVRASRADNTLLTNLFPSAVPQTLQAGLKDTIAWFRTRAVLLRGEVLSG
jgi:UDP-glucose 4-epimerase